jgi:WD40 repeat protein
MCGNEINRRRFLATGAAACLGVFPVVAAAVPKDDAVKARTTVRFVAADRLDCIDEVAFTADRSRVALFHSDRKVTVWETDSGNWLNTLTGQMFEDPELFAFVDDGKSVLAWGGVGFCVAWNVASGKLRIVFEKAGGPGAEKPTRETWYWHGTATNDGKRIATVHDGGGKPTLIRVWDAAEGKQLWEFNNAKGEQAVLAVAFSPDGKLLAAGTQDARVKLFDTATGKLLTTLADGKQDVTQLNWSADGKRLAALQRGTNRKDKCFVWDVATEKLAGVVGPFQEICHIALSPDGKRFAALQGVVATDTCLMIWDVPGEKPAARVKVIGRRGLAWSADGKAVLVVREYAGGNEELLAFHLEDILPK